MTLATLTNKMKLKITQFVKTHNCRTQYQTIGKLIAFFLVFYLCVSILAEIPSLDITIWGISGFLWIVLSMFAVVLGLIFLQLIPSSNVEKKKTLAIQLVDDQLQPKSVGIFSLLGISAFMGLIICGVVYLFEQLQWIPVLGLNVLIPGLTLAENAIALTLTLIGAIFLGLLAISLITFRKVKVLAIKQYTVSKIGNEFNLDENFGDLIIHPKDLLQINQNFFRSTSKIFAIQQTSSNTGSIQSYDQILTYMDAQKESGQNLETLGSFMKSKLKIFLIAALFLLGAYLIITQLGWL